MKTVLVFKGRKSSDEYYDLFVASDYSPEFIPALDYELCNLDILKELLRVGPRAKEITGLILTSQKSVEAINKAYEQTEIDKSVRKEWAELAVYTIGPQTEKMLSTCPLFENESHDHWIQAPCAAELVGPMVSDLKKNTSGGPLFLAGDKRRELIPQALKDAVISFTELQSYATCPHPDLARRLLELEHKEADWAVYFSPSGLKFIQSLLPHSKLLKPSSLKIAAIGPTTADYISQLDLSVHCVAENPDAKHLVQSIVFYDDKNIT